jgi:hypothetical protein
VEASVRVKPGSFYMEDIDRETPMTSPRPVIRRPATLFDGIHPFQNDDAGRDHRRDRRRIRVCRVADYAAAGSKWPHQSLASTFGHTAAVSPPTWPTGGL